MRTSDWLSSAFFVFLCGCGAPVPAPDLGDSATIDDVSEGLLTGTGVFSISAYDSHACALLEYGAVKCWGANASGELGLGNTAWRGSLLSEMGNALRAVPLGSGRSATAVAVGGNFSCALLDNGQVRCWGGSSVGQLGIGSTSNRGDAPNELGDMLPIVQLGTGLTALAITAGGAHACALLSNNQIKCWGRNIYGQLGLGNGLTRGDGPGEMGDNLPVVDLGNGRSAKAVRAGRFHTCALLDNDQVKCWGQNFEEPGVFGGRLGLGDMQNRGDNANEMGSNLPAVSLGTGRTALAIDAGSSHTCAVLDNGQVKCWGANAGGALGLGDTQDRGDGPGEMGDALPAVNLGTGRTAKAIQAGYAFTCAVLDNDQLKCWGKNNAGQLGIGDVAARGDQSGETGDSLPQLLLGTGRSVMTLSVGEVSSCALLDSRRVKCWGSGGARLGIGSLQPKGDAPGEMGDNLPPVDLGSRAVVAFAGGGNHTCALSNGGQVRCWGRNHQGALGLGDTQDRGDAPNEMGANIPTVSLGTGLTAKTVSASPTEFAFPLPFGQHTCAVLSDDRVKCWGGNASGELGLGDVVTRGDGPSEMGNSLAAVNLGTGKTAKVVVASLKHTCAILNDNKVKCWGAGDSGRLGLGDFVTRGDGPSEMGDALPYVDLGTGRTAKQLVAGLDHTCALLDTNNVRCWGGNGWGQLGVGDALDRGDAPGEMGNNLPIVGVPAPVAAITAGNYFSCALTTTGFAYCWGRNDAGQNGVGDMLYHPGPVNPVGLGGVTVLALSAGGSHACAVFTTSSAPSVNQVKCWGQGMDGQLGQGNQATIGDFPNELSPMPWVNLGTGRSARSVSAGLASTCVVLDTGSPLCWGNGAFGRLGDGSTAIRGDGPGEMGDVLPVVDLGPEAL